ncbi:DUF1127 domain-containing protein [Halomonas sp. A29]|uniref:DUF1127 domain-containing protein n=1 Tax=Halomonas sp. A29 TaxID=3102786 RepID=UPI00398AEB35
MNARTQIACDVSSTCVPPATRGRWRFALDLWRWARYMDRLVQLRRERTQLHELNDHLLRDIGVTRQQATREARRPFWDDIGWRR